MTTAWQQGNRPAIGEAFKCSTIKSALGGHGGDDGALRIIGALHADAEMLAYKGSGSIRTNQ